MRHHTNPMLPYHTPVSQVLGRRCLEVLCSGRTFLTTEEVEGLARSYCTTVLGCLVPSTPTPLHSSTRTSPSTWLPLHPAFLHFAAGFYLKSLGEARDLDTLATQVHPSAPLLAVAERGNPPTLTVFSWPDLEVVTTIK